MLVGLHVATNFEMYRLKKHYRGGGIFFFFLMSSDKTLSSEKNDTKVIWFGSVVLILQPFLETHLRRVWQSILVLSLFCSHGSMGVRATMYGSQKSHYPCLKCHENEEKIENDYVLRNDHRIKTTQPISMILVSFFSEDNVLSDGNKICYIFSNMKVTKIERFAFFGGGGDGIGLL